MNSSDTETETETETETKTEKPKVGGGESMTQSTSQPGVETSPFTSTTWRTLRWDLKWSSREL